MNTDQHAQQKPFTKDLLIQALQLSPAPTAIYSGEGMTIGFANEGMLAVWGKDSSVIGKPLIEALPELEGQPFLAILQQVWHTGKTYSVSEAPAELIRNGIRNINYYDYEYKALLDEHGKVWCILNTANDVTAKRAYLQSIQEKELKEQELVQEMASTLEELTATNEELNHSLRLLADSREHVRTIIEQAPIGIAMLQGPKHIIEITNPQILKIWGRNKDEVQGLPHATARPEMAGQPVNQWLDNVFQTGLPKINNEFLVKLNDNGHLREAIVNSIYQPIFSADNEVTGVLVILEEITQQVLEKRKNEKNQAMLSMAINAGGLASFYYEPESNLFTGNALLKEWFGLSQEKSIDLSVAIAAIVEEDRLRVITAISASFDKESDGNYAIEYRIQNPGKADPRLVQARGRVFYDATGHRTSLNGTLRDITQQKKDEQRKDDFIAMVSHELKTPLTSLTAYLQLLHRNAIKTENAKQQATVDKSLRQVSRMNGLISGFLNISRLDSGKLYIQKSEFDLGELFTELQDEMNVVIYSHRIIFQLAERLFVYADREKISQVLQNLVGNAIKYSASGTEIRIRYAIDDGGNIAIAVEDQGMGIAKEDQRQIFERFYRVENPHTGSIAGFGIGLYLCREIVELHQGMLSVESKIGLGSTFIVKLPINSGSTVHHEVKG
jgi:two-component system sensor histidine kinase VicK